MSPELAAAAVAAAEHPARFKERKSIIAFIHRRIASVGKLAKRGRMTEAEAFQLKRWLTALADDIDQQLHDDEPEAED